MALTVAWIFTVLKSDADIRGRLIYVVGPSGAGKNSVIAAAQKFVNKNNSLYFSLRYVTRPTLDADGGNDGDLPITATAFAQYRLSGLFALHWQAHGFSYGIGAEINTALHAGKTVVINGSRAYTETALAKYPTMIVVQIQVPPDVAQARLTARAREDTAAIDARVQRAPPFTVPEGQLITIDNSGPLEAAAQALTEVLLGSNSVRLVRSDTALV